MVDGRDGSAQRLTRLLESEGLSVVEASDGPDALQRIFQGRPDVAVVGVEVSVGDSSLIRILRAACPIPLIALVDGADPAQVIEALGAGADHAIPRGCGAMEFVARLRVAMRRQEEATSGSGGSRRLLRTGSLTIDRGARTVKKHGRRISLSKTQYAMVDALAAQLGEVVPHRFLLSKVWGEAFVDDVHYLRVYIGYLRQKLEDDPSVPQYFVNDWGIGYRLARLPIEIPGMDTQAHARPSATVATA